MNLCSFTALSKIILMADIVDKGTWILLHSSALCCSVTESQNHVLAPHMLELSHSLLGGNFL